MRARDHGDHVDLILPAVQSSGKVCKVACGFFGPALIIFLFAVVACRPAGAQTLTLSAAPTGIALASGGGGSRFSGQFGTVNALGIGTPGAGVQVFPLSNGALYYTTYRLTISGLPGPHLGGVTGFVSTNFLHPAAEIVQSCPDSSACNAAAQFSAMSTTAGAPTTIVAAPGIGNSTVTAGLGIFVPDNNGASAFAGVDTVRITLTLTDLTNNKTTTVQIRLNTPTGETVETAVRLTLAQAAGGLTVSPGADFGMNFGNVNGLGFGPGPGLTTLSVAGGVVYHTAYLLQPAFTDFTSTTATLKTFVSTNFAHPVVLKLEDASATGGPYTALGTTLGTATTITSTAANRSTVTRFLGLFVSNVNGGTAFAGSDAATMTFTMTVP